MDIHFTCRHCQQTLVIDSTGAGETISCPSCYQAILVPVDLIPPDQTSKTKISNNNQLSATEEQRIALDKIRNSARLLVEDYWRNFLTLTHIDPRKAFEAVKSFDATIKMMTENVPEPDASVLRHTIQVERDKLADEYDRNPGALKARLGLANQPPAPVRPQNRQSLEELAVRTAVRATVWESVRSMFRMFR
jgi:hypothetical protein